VIKNRLVRQHLAGQTICCYQIFMSPSIPDSNKKQGRGRRPTGIGRAIGLRLYNDMEKQVDDWIAEQDDNPSRPEAIRRLIQLGLDSWASGKTTLTPKKPVRVKKPAPATNAAAPKTTRQRRS
jgi:hypothetical protein